MSPEKNSPYAVAKLKNFSAATVDNAIDKLLAALDREAAAVTNQSDWKMFRDRWMARKNGLMAAANDLWLKPAPAEEKGYVGKRVNWLKAHVEGRVEGLQNQLLVQDAPGETVVGAQATVQEADFQAYAKDVSTVLAAKRAQAEHVDITLPGIRRPLGAEHPIIKTMNEIVRVFRNLGYSVEEGPEIETDYYNFEALNFPPNHPARDTQDTLFIANQESKPQRERLLLRTHTSPVQIRSMEKMKPPLRVVCPGKVHRNDAPDATHSPIFHQVEGLAVDTNITFCDLKGTLDHAMKALFGSSVKTRFYPSFFPFTEPSADVQISCIFCGGKGQRDGGPCRNCKASGWIELLGCGMVDPNVYGFVDYDPKKVSGFAFGMGVERIAILKYGVDDIQLFFNGDVRFLKQFG
jgi:phenylalanyl-tRNA synthetase alpha chain